MMSLLKMIFRAFLVLALTSCALTPRYTPEERQAMSKIKVYRYYRMMPHNLACEFVEPYTGQDGWISESSLAKGEFFGATGQYQNVLRQIRETAFLQGANVIVIDQLYRPRPQAKSARRFIFKVDASLYKCKPTNE